MNKELKRIAGIANKTWAEAHAEFEHKVLALQWLDERDFRPPEGFRVNIGAAWDRVFIGFITGSKLDIYEMNQEIQTKLRVVPAFDTDYPTRFDCPRLYNPLDDLFEIKIVFNFEEELLEGFLGEFCKIER